MQANLFESCAFIFVLSCVCYSPATCANNKYTMRVHCRLALALRQCPFCEDLALYEHLQCIM